MLAPGNGIRAFVALRLSADVETEIQKFIDSLRPLCHGVRWVPRDNFHLTLRFLGNRVAASQLEALVDELAVCARRTEPFLLTVQGLGGFPNLTRPRVIWIGLHSHPLLELAAQVRAAAARSGFTPEDHPYIPHLTIARVRDPKSFGELRSVLQAARERHFGASTINSAALYRSVLGASAATYLELKRWDFHAC
ncbi:MAG TPA: RNA 2',3'-cyclic phosphodiesterase [Candidatus Binataceae bacterium]|nr:RNA 2',3'-cyclic phosphodiesterase [Candidatus Binataceae bacterium]